VIEENSVTMTLSNERLEFERTDVLIKSISGRTKSRRVEELTRDGGSLTFNRRSVDAKIRAARRRS